MLIDGGGRSLMAVDVGTHGVGPLYPFVDDGGHLSCSQRGVGHTWVLLVVEKKDVCRGLFVDVALRFDPSRKLQVTPHLRCR